MIRAHDQALHYSGFPLPPDGRPDPEEPEYTPNETGPFLHTDREVRDPNEADEGPGQRLRIPERASNRDASPLGLVMRCDGDSEKPAFHGWRYQPVYFDAGVSFLVGENSDRLVEPLCICMPNNPPPGTPQQHSEAPFIEVTAIRLHVPVDQPSSVLDAIARVEGVHVQPNNPHFLEIAFGHEAEGKQRDFRPGLPLKIRW